MAIETAAQEALAMSFPARMFPALLLATVLAACAHGGPAAPAPPPHARWLAIELAGEPVGRTRERVDPAGDGGVTTRISSELRIGRLGAVVEMGSDARFDEDREGRLRGVRLQMNLSRQTTSSEVSFAAGTATIRESAGGAVHTRTAAVGGPLLGPEAIRRLVAAKLRRPGDTLEYRTWSPTLSAPQRVRCTADAVEPIAIDGAPARALRATVVAEGEGQPRIAWFDAAGREARSEIAMPFGKMVATERRAEPPRRAGEVPADAFARTLIRSNVRLPRARALDRLIVRMSFDDPAERLPALDSADERVTRRNAAGAVIEIDRVQVPTAGAAVEEAVAPELLGASAFLDPTDPGVRAIAREAIAGAVDAWDQAQRLTRWVTEHMTFDAGVAFAPAAELARDRHGTCAGYAVLLAALLRAAHIPARVDIGLVYVGGVFAGHAWVEAKIRGRWLPLDAAIPGDGPADAARIALARDALDRGPGALVAALGQVVGRARIRVLGYAPGGRGLVRVDDTAAPYAIDGARYRNPGLGLAITAPAGYRFTDMDAVWPDRTVVALEGAGGRVTFAEAALPPGRDPTLAAARALELASAAACERRTIAGRPACGARRDGVAGVAFGDGPSLYVVEARGRDAQGLLDAVARTVQLDAR